MASSIACSEELHLENDSAVLTKLSSLVSMSLPDMSAAEVDETTQADNCITKTRPGIIDLGSISATFNGIPGGADETFLLEMFSSKSIRSGKLVSGDTGARYEYAIDVWVESLSLGQEAAPGEKREMSTSLRMRLLPTVTAEA